MARKAVFALCLAVAFSSAAYASPYRVADWPDLSGAVVCLAPGGFCAVGKEQAVWLWEKDYKAHVTENLPGDVTALAVGDLNGLSLAAGIKSGWENWLVTYAFKADRWERQGQLYQLWDTPRHLTIGDLNVDGQGDLVVLSEKGEAQIFLSCAGRFYPFWKSPGGEVITHLKVVDINNDGIPEIIYTFKSGYVGVLTWLDQEFVTLWENYPWGLIESLFVLTDSGYPEWLVISSQKMVYGWRLQNGEVVLSRHFHAPYVGEKAFYIPGEGLLSFSAKRGTSLFKLERDSFLELWNIPGFAGAEAFYVNGEFLIRDENYNYFHLIPRSAGWEIYVGGRDVTDQIGTLQAGSLLYFNLEHLGPELGFSIENGRLVQGERFFELEAEKPLVKVDGLPIPLKHPLLLADNDFYAPLDLFSLLGWSPAVDQARQRIEFNKSWGWWF